MGLKEVTLKKVVRREYKRQKPTGIVCSHLEQVSEVMPQARGCQDCMETGDSWVHLRLCMTCGYVGCCNDSKNQHAQKHYHATDHPIMRTFEPNEDWMWCFEDEIYFF